MRKKLALLFCFLLGMFCFAGNASALSYEWMDCDVVYSAGDTIGDFEVIEWKDAQNARYPGNEWEVEGNGSRGGHTGQLWLFSPTNIASTTFTQESTAVGFMMRGDHNDGMAEYWVDDEYVGTFDLYNSQAKDSALIVNGLDYDTHTLKIIQLGMSELANRNYGHVAIFGGAALSEPVPEPTTMFLLGTGLLGLAMRIRKSNQA